jgi:hypothetical protein
MESVQSIQKRCDHDISILRRDVQKEKRCVSVICTTRFTNRQDELRNRLVGFVLDSMDTGITQSLPSRAKRDRVGLL